jgi:uncharacterized membrane protein
MKRILFAALSYTTLSAVLIALPLFGVRPPIGPLGLLAAALGILAAVAVFHPALAGELCGRLDRMAAASRIPALAVIGSLGTILLAVQLARHAAFETQALDLRLHAELIRNLWLGRGFSSPLIDGSYLGYHVSPIFLLLSPLAALPDLPFTLLIVQGIVYAAGAWFAWRLARRMGLRPCLALAWAAMFILYRGTRRGYFEGFHHEVIAACALMGFLYYVECARLLPAALMTLLAVACREDAAILLAGAAVAMLIRQRHRGFAAALLLLGIVWPLVCYLWIMPAYASGGHMAGLDRWKDYGSTPTAVLFGMARHPLRVASAVFSAKVVTLFGLLLFLPLASPSFWLPTLPLLMVYATSSFPLQASLGGAYAAMFAPWWIAAAMHTLSGEKPRKFLGSGRMAVLAGVALLMANLRELPLAAASNNLRQAHALVNAVNRSARAERRVLAQGCLLPHLGWTGCHSMLDLPLKEPLTSYDAILIAPALNAWPMEAAQLAALDRGLATDPRWVRRAEPPVITYWRKP